MLRVLGKDWVPLLSRLLSGMDGVLTTTPQLDLGAAVRFLDLVAQWNEKHDLTAARSSEELVDLYFADALVLQDLAGSGTWLDIGTGGGAPGLSLALLNPVDSITLVEPRAKRVAFLRSVVGALDLGRRVTVRNGRSSDIGDGAAEIAVSRATFSPEEWLAEGARLATQQVWVLLAKGTEPVHSSWKVSASASYVWPLTGVERHAVQYRPAIVA